MSKELTRHSEKRIGFGSHTNADLSVVGFVVDFGFPIVDLVLFGYRQIGLDATFGIEKLNLSAAFNKAVCNLQLWFKLPCLNTLFLDGEKLRK